MQPLAAATPSTAFKPDGQYLIPSALLSAFYPQPMPVVKDGMCRFRRRLKDDTHSGFA
jgi:hypothetical protein